MVNNILFASYEVKLDPLCPLEWRGTEHLCPERRGKEGRAAFSGGGAKHWLSPLQSCRYMWSSSFETLGKIHFFQTESRTVFAPYYRTKGPQGGIQGFYFCFSRALLYQQSTLYKSDQAARVREPARSGMKMRVMTDEELCVVTKHFRQQGP